MLAGTTMDSVAQRHVARTIWEAWTEGTAMSALPEEVRPTSVADGYACQTQLDALGGPRRGWKIAATGAGGRAALGVEQPLAGPLFERFAVPAGGRLDVGHQRMGVAEAEFAFSMADALPARDGAYGRSDILDALGAFHPAIEVPDTRYTDHRIVGAAQLLADAACAGTYVIGEAVDDFDAAALPEHTLQLLRNDARVAEGRGATVLGDPIEAVVWLANELSRHGRGLAAGDIVMTGACAVTRDHVAGDELTADFGALGRLSVSLC
jgi:2-keto-4-pentenoate hydratase